VSHLVANLDQDGKYVKPQGEVETVENWRCEFCEFRILKSKAYSFEDVSAHEEECAENPNRKVSVY